MQVSSDLKCPWCDYAFSENIMSKLEPRVFTQFVCPRCNNNFRVTKIKENTFITSADCSENGLRHNWKHSHVPGYDHYKKCRRCGRKECKHTQPQLPNMRVAAT